MHYKTLLLAIQIVSRHVAHISSHLSFTLLSSFLFLLVMPATSTSSADSETLPSSADEFEIKQLPRQNLPSFYVTGHQEICLVLDFNGTQVVIDGSSSALAFDGHGLIDRIKSSNVVAHIVTCPTDINYRTTERLLAQEPTLPIIGYEKENNNEEENSRRTLEKLSIKTTNTHLYKMRLKPIKIAYSMKSGTVNVYVLAGNKIDEKILYKYKRIEEATESNVIKLAADMGTIVLVVFAPSKMDLPIKRILVSGYANPSRIRLALERAARQLRFLLQKTVTSAQYYGLEELEDIPDPSEPPKRKRSTSIPPQTKAVRFLEGDQHTKRDLIDPRNNQLAPLAPQPRKSNSPREKPISWRPKTPFNRGESQPPVRKTNAISRSQEQDKRPSMFPPINSNYQSASTSTPTVVRPKTVHSLSPALESSGKLPPINNQQTAKKLKRSPNSIEKSPDNPAGSTSKEVSPQDSRRRKVRTRSDTPMGETPSLVSRHYLSKKNKKPGIRVDPPLGEEGRREVKVEQSYEEEEEEEEEDNIVNEKVVHLPIGFPRIPEPSSESDYTQKFYFDLVTVPNNGKKMTLTEKNVLNYFQNVISRNYIMHTQGLDFVPYECLMYVAEERKETTRLIPTVQTGVCRTVKTYLEFAVDKYVKIFPGINEGKVHVKNRAIRATRSDI